MPQQASPASVQPQCSSRVWSQACQSQVQPCLGQMQQSYTSRELCNRRLSFVPHALPARAVPPLPGLHCLFCPIVLKLRALQRCIPLMYISAMHC